MEQISGADAYLNEVLAHVRWKKAHDTIRRELCDHIEDARLGFLARGMADSDAQKNAVMEMGDAAEVGARFDAAYRPAKNYGVWIPFLLIMAAGFFLRSYSAWPRELPVFTFLAPAVFLGFRFLRLEWFVKHAWTLYGLYLLSIIVSPFLASVGDSRAVHYLPMLFPLVYALLIYRARGRGLMSILLLGAAFVLQMLFAFSGNYTVMAMLALVCLFELLYAVFSGWFSCRKWVAALLIFVPTLLFAVLFTFAIAPYSIARLTAAFSSPEIAYFPALVKSILSKTAWFGAVNASAFTKPEQSELFGNSNIFLNDFLLVWLSARLGRIVFVLAGGLFAAFYLFTFRACLKQKSMLYRLASLGITLHLFIQFAGYFLVNLGIVHLFTYPLPFVSSGNAAMLVNAALMGLLFSMFYNGSLMDDEAVKKLPRWRIKLVKEFVFDNT